MLVPCRRITLIHGGKKSTGAAKPQDKIGAVERRTIAGVTARPDDLEYLLPVQSNIYACPSL